MPKAPVSLLGSAQWGAKTKGVPEAGPISGQHALHLNEHGSPSRDGGTGELGATAQQPLVQIEKAGSLTKVFNDWCLRYPANDPPAVRPPLFPKEESSKPSKEKSVGGTGAGVQQPGGQTTAGITDANRGEGATRRMQQRTAARVQDTLRRQKVEEWSSHPDRNNRELRKENERLAKIAQLTQENALSNDERYEEAVSSLRAQIEYTSLFRSHSNETMTFVQHSIKAINDRLSEIRDTAERQRAIEMENIRAAFDRQVELRSKELDQARKDGESKKDQWVQQNKALKKEMEDLLGATDAAYSRHKSLNYRHRRLLIENQTQAEDAALLAKQWNQVSSRHRLLKDRAHELELSLAGAERKSALERQDEAQQEEEDENVAAQGTEKFLAETAQLAAKTLTGEANDPTSRNQLQNALRRAQILLETEASNLRSVRNAHIQALRQRTELEVYLRQAVLRHQSHMSGLHYSQRAGGIKASSGGTGLSSPKKPHYEQPLQRSGASESSIQNRDQVSYANFCADDRRLVIEALLSLPRVLQLLYQPDEATLNQAQGENLRDDLLALGLPPPEAIADPTLAEEYNNGIGQQPRSSPMANEVLTAEAQAKQAQELDTLWQQWKQWGVNAQTQLAEQAARKELQAAVS